MTENGYYRDTKHSQAVTLIKMAVGAVTGKALDDSIEAKINVTIEPILSLQFFVTAY